MKIKNALLFILLNSIILTSMSWADETQKQVNSAETISDAEKMALHKRCEEDPDWCEERKKAKNSSDDENCIENFTCEKIQDNPTVAQTPPAVETQAIQEKWCTDNPEICKQLNANTEKLHDLQKQIDELRRTLHLHQKNTDQQFEESSEVGMPVTDQ